MHGGMHYGMHYGMRYAMLGLLELFDAAPRQPHHGASLHLQHEQLRPALQEGGQAAHARLKDVGPHRGRGKAL